MTDIYTGTVDHDGNPPPKINIVNDEGEGALTDAMRALAEVVAEKVIDCRSVHMIHGYDICDDIWTGERIVVISVRVEGEPLVFKEWLQGQFILDVNPVHLAEMIVSDLDATRPEANDGTHD
ncbi:hypothetical protein LCGC14_0387180 [marine sediment metagenome]|uniref:Uncharacterized protein n=1 Tax=marine sediment metagenome TaxID=412755 RepID=A0A0F9T0S6_9ZZZZ